MNNTIKTSSDPDVKADGASCENPSDMTLMFGKPLLLQGESREAYEFLEATVRRTLAPTTFFGELRVREMTDCIWEQQRYKRFAARLSDTGSVTALQILFQDQLWANSGHRPAKLAMDYYWGDEEERRFAHNLAHACDITDELIQAKAQMVVSGEISCCERIIDKRTEKLKVLLGDDEREKRKAEKARQRETKQAQQPNKVGVNDNIAAEPAAKTATAT